MNAQFSFRPAPLRAAVQVELAGDVLLTGAEGRLDLASVGEARFVRHRIRRQVMARLDLLARGEVRRLSLSLPASGWPASPDAQSYLACLIAVLRRLETTRPDLEVTLGEQGGARWAMFLIGLVSALAGLGIFALALATGVAGERLAVAALPMLALLVLGGLVMAGYAPWRPLPRLAAGELAQRLDGLRGAQTLSQGNEAR